MLHCIVTLQGGHLVFESSQPTEQETQDTTDTSASVNYITVMDRVPEASPSGYRLVPRRVAIADLVISAAMLSLLCFWII